MSKEAKFTPGPWKLDYTVNENYAVFTGMGVNRSSHEPQHMWVSNLNINDDAPLAQHHEAEANALLMAAAPEMYDELKAIRDVFEAHDAEVFKDSIEHLDNVLAKARGES